MEGGINLNTSFKSENNIGRPGNEKKGMFGTNNASVRQGDSSNPKIVNSMNKDTQNANLKSEINVNANITIAPDFNTKAVKKAGSALVNLIKFPLNLLISICRTISQGIANIMGKVEKAGENAKAAANNMEAVVKSTVNSIPKDININMNFEQEYNIKTE